MWFFYLSLCCMICDLVQLTVLNNWWVCSNIGCTYIYILHLVQLALYFCNLNYCRESKYNIEQIVMLINKNTFFPHFGAPILTPTPSRTWRLWQYCLQLSPILKSMSGQQTKVLVHFHKCPVSSVRKNSFVSFELKGTTPINDHMWKSTFKIPNIMALE